jgi:hypothetical protein
MKVVPVLIPLVALLWPSPSQAELRIIGVRVVQQPEKAVRVSLYSDVAAENKNNLKVEDAAAILANAQGWGSSVMVGIIAHGVPFEEYLPLLQAIAKNGWLTLAFIEGDSPNFVHENIRQKIGQADQNKPEAKNESAWLMSQNGTLGIRLRTKTDPLMADDAFVMVALIRNFSDKPLSVMKPFSGPFIGMPSGLAVSGRRGKVKYIGPAVQPRMHERGDFVNLMPGQVLQDEIGLGEPAFAGAETPGEYFVSFSYSTLDALNLAKDLCIDNLWSGTIKVTTKARRVDAKRPLPPKAGTQFSVTTQVSTRTVDGP